VFVTITKIIRAQDALSLCCTRELVTDSIYGFVGEQVAIFWHVVGQNQRFRVVDLTFRRSIKTISRFFKIVLYAVGELRNEMIVPPSTNVHPKIHGSRRWYPYFKVGYVIWTSLGPLPRWVPRPTTRWAPGTTRLVPHGT
jgi:hypothetical protein